MPSSPTLKLGHVDSELTEVDPGQCVAPYHDWTSHPGEYRGEPNNSWKPLTRKSGPLVASLQQGLKDLGFNPRAAVDGIFGYRTQSAVRLFQEYIATVEGDHSIGTADGIAGPKTLSFIDQALAGGMKADWTPADDRQAEIFGGLNLLREHFQTHTSDPSTQALNASPAASSSRKAGDWTFDPADIHLLGIRRDDTRLILDRGKFVRRNDDIFVLLVNGFRIVFRGSTDPSPKMADRDDAAFLIRGQHEYRFGWHKISSLHGDNVRVYRAFKPRTSNGVLVVRATDGQLTPASYERGAQANNSINIHWSGAGTSNWSAGCQVIAGKKYKNHRNEIIDLSASASAGYTGLGGKTRGAYNLLMDLATVFARDIRCNSSDTLLYTLLYECDLAQVPGSGGIDFRGLLAELS